MTLKLKGLSKLYMAYRVFTQFVDQQPVYGTVVISNDLVMVNGAERLSLHRDLLMGITPSGGKGGIRNWSGEFNLDVSFVWDYLQNPQTRSDGAIPQKNDYFLTVVSV